METLFDHQISHLELHHFLILYWSAESEVQQVKYNITNVFDDLKEAKITRTKQNVMAYVESLEMMCFIEVRDEKNRKNLYLTEFGAMALEKVNKMKSFRSKKSRFLSTQKG